MKLITTACILIFSLSHALLLQAQNFTMDWFTIDGGGSASIGGVYSVTGTIGQSDAYSMSGGNYSINGGFWGIVAPAQTPGTPLLRIVLTETNTVVVAWPAPSTGFVLYQSAPLQTMHWVSVTNMVVAVGDEYQVIVSPPVGSRFYRLVHP